MIGTAARSIAERFDLPGLTAELARYAAEVDRERRAPVEGLTAVAERGLMGALIPAEYGGLGLSSAELFAVSSAISEGCGSTGLIWGQHLAATAIISLWGTPATLAVLPASARGERTFGIGIGHIGKTPTPVSMRRADGRVYYSGSAPWITGSAVMTDVLLAARDDAHNGAILMAVIPAASVRIVETYGMVAVSGGMNGTITFDELDVTDGLLASPPERGASSAVFNQNKSPRDAGFYTGLSRAALALCRRIPSLEAEPAGQLERVERAVEEAAAGMTGWLETHGWAIDQPAFWEHYNRCARLMVETAALCMSAGGSGGLFDGAPHNRVLREAGYYIARVPFRRWVAETAAGVECEP